MKTVAELALECGVHRTTLNKAIDRSVFGKAAHKSGDTWLIDEESDEFKAWLAGSHLGRPRTIRAETPDAPPWVNTQAAKYAWKSDHSWRCNAASADTEQYRFFLLREAERIYGS